MLRARRARSTRWPPPAGFIVGFVGFGMIIAFEFAFIKLISHADVKQIDLVLDAPVLSMSVNNQSTARTDDILRATKTMHATIGHHSHPTTRFQVHIETSVGSVTLIVRRDSSDPHEYWVFDQNYHVTKMNAVAHAFTNGFD